MNKEIKCNEDGYEQLKIVEKELQGRILKLLRLLAEASPAEKKCRAGAKMHIS